jgi:hypothetical protein
MVTIHMMKPNQTSEVGTRPRTGYLPGVLSLMIFLAAGSAVASPLAVTPSGTLIDSLAPYAITTAWDFQLDRSFQVTALDFYTNGSPYFGSHQVGLWATSVATGYPVGTLLATVTFSAGTPGTVNGAYRSLPISPLVLNPGFYEVGVFVDGGPVGNFDPYLYSQTSYALQPGVIFNGQGHVNTSGTFTYPGTSNAQSGSFAANFEGQAVPVPGAAFLFGSALGLLGLRRKITPA